MPLTIKHKYVCPSNVTDLGFVAAMTVDPEREVKHSGKCTKARKHKFTYDLV